MGPSAARVGDVLRAGVGGARRSHVAGGKATWRARRRHSRRRCQRLQPPPKSGEGSESNLKLLAPTWEAQTSPSSPRLLLSHGERLRAEDPDLLQEKARLSAGGPSPCLHPPCLLGIAGGVRRRSRWQSLAIKARKLIIVGEKLSTFVFRHLDAELQTTHLLIFCLLSSQCRE